MSRKKKKEEEKRQTQPEKKRKLRCWQKAGEYGKYKGNPLATDLGLIIQLQNWDCSSTLCGN